MSLTVYLKMVKTVSFMCIYHDKIMCISDFMFYPHNVLEGGTDYSNLYFINLGGQGRRISVLQQLWA